MEVRYYKGERIPWKPHDCTESNTCTFCRREKRRFISALNSHKAQTPMHTPPDKCPKCGSVATGADRDLFTNAPLIFNFNCESKQDALSGDIHESRLCMAWQRAQKAEGKLKQVETFCQHRAGHRLMQVAQPFRELLNLLKD